MSAMLMSALPLPEPGRALSCPAGPRGQEGGWGGKGKGKGRISRGGGGGLP